ncbi:MAG: VOC family protein [Myxococcota bacterium]
MKPVDLVKQLRRDAALDPAVLDRERARLMSQIESQGAPRAEQVIVPQLPYADPRAAVEFLERAFGFTERLSARVVDKRGVVGHTMVEYRGAPIGIGGQGGHGAVSPKAVGTPTLYLSVYVPDVDAHCEHARAAGARIVVGLRDQFWGDRTYEALDLEGHRWRFHQKVREVPQSEWSWSSTEDKA